MRLARTHLGMRLEEPKTRASPDRNVRAIFHGIPNIIIRFDVKHKFHLLTMQEKVCVYFFAKHCFRSYVTTTHIIAFYAKNVHSFRFRVYYVIVRCQIRLLVSSVSFGKARSLIRDARIIVCPTSAGQNHAQYKSKPSHTY